VRYPEPDRLAERAALTQRMRAVDA
jgi:hypothetical protein